MAELGPRRLATYAAIALVVVIGAAWYLLANRAPGGTVGGGTATQPGAGVEVREQAREQVVLHVTGAVHRPGLVRVRAGQRVADAVRAAGGPTRRADLTGLNLAAEVEDGRQVIVPAKVAGGAAAAASGAGAASTAGAGTAPPPPVNLNTATAEELDALDGVGPGIAQRILEYRQEHGGFSSVDELGEVSGIGEKRLEALREQVRL
jgi:competence protein ComEA